MAQASTHRYDPEVEATVLAARSALAGLGHNAEHWQSLIAAGTNLGEALEMTKAECDALQATARALYQSQDWDDAVQVAVCAVACDPRNSAYAYLAGACLQKLGKSQEAAGMYAAALENDGANGAAVFRLGQCLRQMGKREEARAAFELSLEISRSDESMRAVQDAALASLSNF